MNKRISNSLKIQLLCAVIVSLLAGIAVFGVSFLLGSSLLDRTVYGHVFARKMADQQFSRLQNYVEKNAISKHNLQQLNGWHIRGAKVYLAIYDENVLIYESRILDKQNSELATQEFNPDMEDSRNEYVLTLADGRQVRTFLYYSAGDIFDFLLSIVCCLPAFVAFVFCFILLIGRKLAYISTLKQELDILSGGQLEYPITVLGKDELGELAAGIDQMRRSIIKHQEAENQIRSANSELITAMSHDLRTPLTALLAYLEIIERKKYADEEQMQSLVQKSVAQTMRIKKMADKLFEYFLAYATEWEAADMETVDADGLFAQIMGDYVYALESNGMTVETDFSPVPARIRVNTGLLQRALDNLYSNVLKYADPEEVVRISYSPGEQNIVLTISNGIRENREKVESTSIGLISSRRIIEYHKGSLTVSEEEGNFQVVVAMPLL